MPIFSHATVQTRKWLLTVRHFADVRFYSRQIRGNVSPIFCRLSRIKRVTESEPIDVFSFSADHFQRESCFWKKRNGNYVFFCFFIRYIDKIINDTTRKHQLNAPYFLLKVKFKLRRHHPAVATDHIFRLYADLKWLLSRVITKQQKNDKMLWCKYAFIHLSKHFFAPFTHTLQAFPAPSSDLLHSKWVFFSSSFVLHFLNTIKQH